MKSKLHVDDIEEELGFFLSHPSANTPEKIDAHYTKCAANFLDDLEKRRIKPQAWYPLTKLAGFHKRYGMTDSDDLIFFQAPVEEIQRFNPSWTPPGVYKMYVDKVTGKPVEKYHPAKTCLSFALNPEKYNMF